jgi:hypothetical protein
VYVELTGKFMNLYFLLKDSKTVVHNRGVSPHIGVCLI